MDETTLLKNENEQQAKKILKLKKKIKKEREDHEKLLKEIESSRDTLQQLYTSYQKETQRKLEDVDDLQAKFKQLKKRNKLVEQELERFKKLLDSNHIHVIPNIEIGGDHSPTSSFVKEATSPNVSDKPAEKPSPNPELRGSNEQRSNTEKWHRIEDLKDHQEHREGFATHRGPLGANRSATEVPSNAKSTLRSMNITAQLTFDGNKSTGTTVNTNPTASPSSMTDTWKSNMVPNSGKPLMLSVVSHQMNLKYPAPLDQVVSETITKLKKRYPRQVSSYSLFCKSGKGCVRLEPEKTWDFYKHILEESKGEVVFAAPVSVSADGSLKPLLRASSAELMQWITKGDVTQIRDFLEQDIHFPEMEQGGNEWGQNPLHAAVMSGNVDIARLFLEYFKRQQMNINVTDKNGWTVLHHAVSNKTGNDSDVEILTLVLECPNIQADIENTDNNTALHYFCSDFVVPSCQEIGEKLIKMAPSSINKKNKGGEAPIHKAIMNRAVRVLMTKLLIKHGADVNVAQAKGYTALHYAVQLGRLDLLKILIQGGGDLSLKNAQKATPYDLAVQEKQDEVAKSLKNAQDLQGWLKELELSEYFKEFLAEELYLDILAWVDEKMMDVILDNIGITGVGTRLRFKKACQTLQDYYSRQEFEKRMNKVMSSSSAQAHANDKIKVGEIGQLKQDLSKLVSQQDETSWLILHKQLEFTKELGNGKSGTVFKGIYKGAKVAIKVLKAQAKQSTLEEFKKEFQIMSVLKTPQIVHFYGACLEPRICIVMEYCSRGSLYHVLKGMTEPLPMDIAFQFAIETTFALRDLHNATPPILHRDMKSLNLLVTKDYHVKICDFGLARFDTEENMETLGKVRGTYAYLAPELFSGEMPHTDKADIFSLSIILWEVFSTVARGKYEAPYTGKGFKEVQIFYQVSNNKVRPTVPPGIPPPILAMIESSWAHSPEERPSANQLLDTLLNLKRQFVKETPTQAVAPEVRLFKRTQTVSRSN